ncbi:MAG: ATP-binding cassette domain-containing protein [Devosia sp.]
MSITLSAGETLGLLGPSGSGKSTLARVITRLVEPDAGQVSFAGQDWLGLTGSTLRRQRRLMQMVFQDPLGAFNPRASVLSAITDPLRIHRLAPRSKWRMKASIWYDPFGLGLAPGAPVVPDRRILRLLELLDD